MKRPAIQLYFGDLLKNPKVLRCSWGARGALIWTMSILHDSDEYGAVRWALTEIARAVGCPLPLVKELASKGALKGGDKCVEAYRWAPSHAGKRGPEVLLVPEQNGPLWYSSRMVRDEYKRTNRGIGTRFGSPKKLPTGTPNTTPNATPSHREGDGKGEQNITPSRREGDGASSSSSFLQRSSEVNATDIARAKESNSAKIAFENNESQTQKPNGGQQWDDQVWVNATALTVGKTRLPGEDFCEFRDRVYGAIQAKIAQAKRAIA